MLCIRAAAEKQLALATVLSHASVQFVRQRLSTLQPFWREMVPRAALRTVWTAWAASCPVAQQESTQTGAQAHGWLRRCGARAAAASARCRS